MIYVAIEIDHPAGEMNSLASELASHAWDGISQAIEFEILASEFEAPVGGSNSLVCELGSHCRAGISPACEFDARA